MSNEGRQPAAEIAQRNGSDGEPQVVAESVADVVELGRRERRSIGLSERIAHRVTLFGGSMLFVWLNAAWYATWIIVNLPGIGWQPFDPFPFTFLTMIVSLEAIFLSTFVLITQNQQSRESDRRDQVDLQINTIAEREVTKVLQLLADIHQHLGIERAGDAELSEMQRQTPIQQLAEETEAAEAERG